MDERALAVKNGQAGGELGKGLRHGLHKFAARRFCADFAIDRAGEPEGFMVLLLGGDVVPTDLPRAAVRLYPPIGLPNCKPMFAGGNEICFAGFKSFIAPCDVPIVAGNPDGMRMQLCCIWPFVI